MFQYQHVLHAFSSFYNHNFKNAPQPTPKMHAHSAPVSVLFVVVLCGSVESVLLSELFKLFFHRCLYDFLGQLPFEWETTNCTPVQHAAACAEHTAL